MRNTEKVIIFATKDNCIIMKIINYLGIIVTILGAILLVLSFVLDLVDNNAILVSGALVVVCGIVIHYFVNKITPTYDAPEAPIGSAVTGIVSVITILAGVGLTKAICGPWFLKMSTNSLVELLAKAPERVEEFGLYNPPASVEDLLENSPEAATQTAMYGVMSIAAGILGAALLTAIWLGIAYAVNKAKLKK